MKIARTSLLVAAQIIVPSPDASARDYGGYGRNQFDEWTILGSGAVQERLQGVSAETHPLAVFEPAKMRLVLRRHARRQLLQTRLMQHEHHNFVLLQIDAAGPSFATNRLE